MQLCWGCRCSSGGEYGAAVLVLFGMMQIPPKQHPFAGLLCKVVRANSAIVESLLVGQSAAAGRIPLFLVGVHARRAGFFEADFVGAGLIAVAVQAPVANDFHR